MWSFRDFYLSFVLLPMICDVETRRLFILLIFFLHHSAFPARHWKNLMQRPKDASLPGVLKSPAELL